MTGEPTKPDLVAHVRAITEAAERKDVDAIVAYFSADALCETRFMMTRGRSTPPEATWHGAPGNARATWEAFVKWHMGWPEHEWNIKQIGDRIVLLVSHHVRRFDWGIMGMQEAASIFEWEDGLVTRLSRYGSDAADAREVAHRLAETPS